MALFSIGAIWSLFKHCHGARSVGALDSEDVLIGLWLAGRGPERVWAFDPALFSCVVEQRACQLLDLVDVDDFDPFGWFGQAFAQITRYDNAFESQTCCFADALFAAGGRTDLSR